MALKFGTSGVRGLVTEMTDRDCYLYSRAFAQHLAARAPEARRVALAGDLRSSTPRIMRAVAAALADEGLEVDHCGFLATPAVTAHAMRLGAASVMVTGSHIPDDRNGIKFNMPWGEVLKADEAEISRRHRELSSSGDLRQFDRSGSLADAGPPSLGEPSTEARSGYLRRFVDFLPGRPLEGKKVVFYQHSSVSRDLFVEILRDLGAEVVAVGRSDTFVPVDTEAVEEPERLAGWVAEHAAFALLSTDGDADRPLVVDERGEVVRGDVLGILVAEFLGAEFVATPVSSNTALERSGRFAEVARTRIGSPYVIEAMAAAVDRGREVVVGYEANGGFLTATDLASPLGGEVLPALPTRDAVLPAVVALVAAARRGLALSALVSALPERYTASGLLRGVPQERGLALVERFASGGLPAAREAFGRAFGEPESIDFTDGARITFRSGVIVHLRPSGNAPEFRCYTESDSQGRADEDNARALEVVREVV